MARTEDEYDYLFKGEFSFRIRFFLNTKKSAKTHPRTLKLAFPFHKPKRIDVPTKTWVYSQTESLEREQVHFLESVTKTYSDGRVTRLALPFFLLTVNFFFMHAFQWC